MAEGMTVTELAEAVGMTPRNIRAYQSRGLLFPPAISGRVARYSGAHVARLELIASLQREGFTLAAIKRLISTPSSYSAIVADRRRRFRDGSSDIVRTVPIPEDRIRSLLPDLPEDLTDTGLAWRDKSGQLVSHTLLVAVGRMLSVQGVPLPLVTALQLDAAQAARELGEALRAHLFEHVADARSHDDLAKIAVQLSATAFEIAFLAAASRDGDEPETEPVQPA
jgi:DNA-binding transcriptional MerR regulator